MKDFARDELLRLKWSDGPMELVDVEYVSRGSPGDRAHLNGSEIERIGRSFIVTGDDTHIPFHRVKRITVDGRTTWVRNGGRP